MPINISSLGTTWRLLPEENAIAYNNTYNNTYNDTYTYENSSYYFTFSYCPKEKETIRDTVMDIE